MKLKSLRKIAILLINAALFLQFAGAIFFNDYEGCGLPSTVAIICLFVFNIYALILYKLFWRNPQKLWYLEAFFLVLLSLPVLIVL